MTDLFDDLPRVTEPVDWTPTRDAGLQRLQSFLPRAGRAYASNRNFDFGADDRSNVSALSPWLRHRLIPETEVLSAVLAKHGYNAAEKFVQEVFWRGYFKGWLQHRPAIWDRYRDGMAELSDRLGSDTDLRGRYDQAIAGKTGIACFDHWADELTDTGYLHNHARMWFASIWIFTLKLPWQLGADFFAQHLLDWDPASNTLSWRWVGGLHTVGKTYLARPENIAKYTNGRFNPAGQLATDAPALPEGDPPPAGSLPDLSSAPAGTGPSILLITDEDVHIDRDVLRDRDIKGVIGLTGASARSPFPVSSDAISFAHAAVATGVSRAASELGSVPHKIVNGSDWGKILSDFANDCGAHRIVSVDIPTGPSDDALKNSMPGLSAAGLEVNAFRRPYDQAVWPHAKKGFFGLKKQIPTILSSLGISG